MLVWHPDWLCSPRTSSAITSQATGVCREMVFFVTQIWHQTILTKKHFWHVLNTCFWRHVHGTLIYSIRSWKVLLWKNWWFWTCFRAISNAYRNKICPAHNRSALWQLLHSTKKDLKQCKAQVILNSEIHTEMCFRTPMTFFLVQITTKQSSSTNHFLWRSKNLKKKFSTRPRLGSSVDYFLKL